MWCAAFALLFRNRPDQHPSVNDEEARLIGRREESGEEGHAVPWRARFATNPSLIALCLMYSLINYGWGFNITYLAGYLQERYAVPDNDLWGAIYKGAPLWVGAVGCSDRGTSSSARSRGARRPAARSAGRLHRAAPDARACWWFAPSAPDMHWFCLLISLGPSGSI